MAGRQRGGRAPPHPAMLIEERRFLRRGPPPPPAALIEERIAGNHREIQALLLDNQQLGAAHVALKQELSLAEHELQQLVVAAREVREEREMKVKDLFERSLKFESEVRVCGIDALKAELAQVRADIQRLTESKIELAAQFKAIDAELSRARVDARDVPAIRADVDSMRQELQKGRAAVEFEKKTRAANIEQRRAMERNMVSLEREIDRLLAELANAEKRARAAAAAAANPNPGYMGNYASSNMAYGGGPYSQYAMHQAQTIADGASPAPFGPPVGGNGPSNMQ